MCSMGSCTCTWVLPLWWLAPLGTACSVLPARAGALTSPHCVRAPQGCTSSPHLRTPGPAPPSLTLPLLPRPSLALLPAHLPTHLPTHPPRPAPLRPSAQVNEHEDEEDLQKAFAKTMTKQVDTFKSMFTNILGGLGKKQ